MFIPTGAVVLSQELFCPQGTSEDILGCHTEGGGATGI